MTHALLRRGAIERALTPPFVPPFVSPFVSPFMPPFVPSLLRSCLPSALAAALCLAAIGELRAQAPSASQRSTAATSVPAALAAEPRTSYTVQPGDTVIGVTRKLLWEPRNWRLVARLNALRDPDVVNPGQVLQIPESLLRMERVPAQLLAAQGDTQADGAAAATVGTPLAEGTRLRTGANSSLSLRLVDGTVLHLRGTSELTLSESRRFSGLEQNRSAVELHDGRVEVQTPKAAAGSGGGAPGFEVRTKQGVLGVRGTEFRVGAEAAAGRSVGEVIEGTVAAAGKGAAAGTEQLVRAGFGTVVDNEGRVAVPVPLLPAPALGGLPALQEKVLVRFEWPALAGAAGYRAQIAPAPAAAASASAAAAAAASASASGSASAPAAPPATERNLQTLLVDEALATPLLRVGVLSDGDYVLRLRGRDAQGLEGLHADHVFTLKARPEPPLLQQPRAGTRLIGRVELGWATNPDAARYRLQVFRAADGAAAAAPVLDQTDIAEPRWLIETLPPGPYRWRVRSLRLAGEGARDEGPWGDPSSFELRALPPAAPPPRVEADDLGATLAWALPPQGRVDLQIASDQAFTRPLLERRLDTTELRFEPPAGGTYFVRLRFIEPDGLLGPWGGAQTFVVPPCVRSADRRCVRGAGQPVLGQP